MITIGLQFNAHSEPDLYRHSNFILRSLPDYILAIAFVSHHIYYLNRNFVVVITSVQRTYIIENKLTENGRVKRESINNVKGKYTPCLANNRTLRYKEVVNAISALLNQMLYLQAVIFQIKTVISTHMQNSYWQKRYVTSTSIKKKIRKDLIKERTSGY